MIMKRGFALIEVLIYIAILIIATGAVVTTFLGLRDVFERNRVMRELADAGAQIAERLSREIRVSDGLDVGSVLGSSFGTLALSQGSDKVEVYVSGGNVVLEENDGAASPLTPDSVTVTSLIFRHYTHGAGESEAVRAEITLSVSGRYAAETKTFYTTAVMRGTYE